MRHSFTIVLLGVLISFTAFSQKYPLDYFLPPSTYDPAIPSPEQVLGWQIGEWHLTHDQLLLYYRALDAASDKITLQEHSRSHEGRPLIHLVITSKRNHDRLQEIQDQHLALTDPELSAGLDVSNMPVVIYQGFSIHGNEPSGANAAPLVAYRLAASNDPEVAKLLEVAVIIFDPCFNPDGGQRFSSWVNQHKNKNMTPESADREYNEVWPGGRTNHYWFDLNRDWLPGQQPESQGRIRLFHDWKPNILTDHHEMGTNSSFFFMPGVQSRVNPLTPKRNQELTAKIGAFHAKALDAIGSLYYSEEGFDDFYYGKGSTFPDANGCIGILFEQGSSRGHLQNSENGLLTFPFTIRNQVRTALSTQQAAIALRTELLEFQRDFYRNNLDEGRRDARKAFVVGEKSDRTRLLKFVEMLQRHQIRVHELGKNCMLNGKNFEPGSAFVVPLDQPQYKLVMGIFQRETTFTDSIFYDISAWTMPLAFNLDYEAAGGSFSKDLLGKEYPNGGFASKAPILADAKDYAFAFEWDEYFAPAFLYKLLKNKLLVKVASKPFSAQTRSGLKDFTYGTVVIATQNQPMSEQELFSFLEKNAAESGITVHGISTGLTPSGIDLGSNNMEPLRLPNVALVVGDGVNSNDAGEIWHLLDTRYGIPVVKIESGSVSESSLAKFNLLILPAGNYARLNAEALRTWANNGGTIVAFEGAVKWLQERQLANVEYKKPKEDSALTTRRPYDGASEDADAQSMPGAIFEADLDRSHPMCYGYRNAKLPVFRSSNDYLEPANGAYASPLVYAQKPLMAGYLHRKFEPLAAGSPAVLVSGQGAGRVICFADNVCFRAFWYGTNKLLANAVFFGNTIGGGTTEKVRKK